MPAHTCRLINTSAFPSVFKLYVVLVWDSLIYLSTLCLALPSQYDSRKTSDDSKKGEKQEMSQSRDECPQRNWSSIRHIRGKLAVIKEICSRHEKPRSEARSQCEGKSDTIWYAPLRHPKRNQHTKFGIPTSNNIGDMLHTRLF